MATAFEMVTVRLSPEVADRLRALAGTRYGPADLEGVIMELVDHAQQGVYRSGAWEREWVCQVFGDEWLSHMEPDPANVGIGWQRPAALT